MGLLLRVSAFLALAISTITAQAAFDCGNTNIVVTGSLQRNFDIGPNADCTYVISWAANTGSYIESHVDGLDADYMTSASMYNEFGKNIRFGNYRSLGLDVNDVNMYWAPQSVKLAFRTGANSKINAKIFVKVSDAIKGASVQNAQVVTGSDPIVVSDNLKLGNTYTYTSTSKIALAGARPGESQIGKATYFDSVFVYDGAELLGSLNEVIWSTTRVLKSNSVTLLPIAQAQLEGKVVINNQQNIAAFNAEKVLYFFSHRVSSPTSGVLLDSREGQGTSTILSFGVGDYPIITGIRFADTATRVKVYSGYPTNKMAGNYITEFTSTTPISTPRPFPGTAITFTVDSGFAVISYTSALTPPAK